MNGTATHEWTIVYDASHPPPIWRPLKTSPPKVDKPTYGTKLYNIMQCFTPIGAMYLSSDKKNTYFPYRRLSWGLPCYTFLESSCRSSQCYASYDTLRCDLPFSRYSRSKIGILGPLMGYPQKVNFVSETISVPDTVWGYPSCRISRRSVSPSPKYL